MLVVHASTFIFLKMFTQPMIRQNTNLATIRVWAYCETIVLIHWNEIKGIVSNPI